MYLKALEIQGFKSFPDKTRLNFDQEITAIVGPNGSGKSNISDAILWVMGEQRTKTLRGGKMEDVIFGGTEKRSPMGFAQVSLILDNSTGIFDTENTEVMITRRYYRSGESEYYINREACRLRDINELLMDTGLGRDGYSIIGQGRIAEIVSCACTTATTSVSSGSRATPKQSRTTAATVWPWRRPTTRRTGSKTRATIPQSGKKEGRRTVFSAQSPP